MAEEKKPVVLTRNQKERLSILGKQKLMAVAAYAQQIKDLEDFEKQFVQYVLSEQGITEGNYKLDFENGLLVPNLPATAHGATGGASQ